MSDLIVSVIICTYNREKFLPDSLDSVAAQQADKNAFELVVVNNNCTDRTDDIVRQFIEKHPDLKVTYVVEMKKDLSSMPATVGILESKRENTCRLSMTMPLQNLTLLASGSIFLQKKSPKLRQWAGRSWPNMRAGANHQPGTINTASAFTGAMCCDQSFQYTGYDYP
ncbi:MAG: glycosyltransferase [Saprospiraceae bacterium]